MIETLDAQIESGMKWNASDSEYLEYLTAL